MTQLSDLTARRREIAELVGAGHSYAEIAAKLRNLRSYRGGTICASTVKMHVNAIAQMIGEDGVPPKVRVMLWVRHQAPRAA